MVTVDFSQDEFCDWERKKAIYLLSVAEKLGMDTSGYGELAVNPNSGYTYLWIENYYFTLYMPINCDLVKTDVWASCSDPKDGEEHDLNLTNDTTLEDLEEWAEKCIQKKVTQ